MMTSRERFETWLRSQPHVLNVGVEPDGTYTLHEDRVAWEAWKASREAVEVELPAWFVWGAIAVFDRDEVEKAMSDAGIKVKGE